MYSEFAAQTTVHIALLPPTVIAVQAMFSARVAEAANGSSVARLTTRRVATATIKVAGVWFGRVAAVTMCGATLAFPAPTSFCQSVTGIALGAVEVSSGIDSPPFASCAALISSLTCLVRTILISFE